MSHKMGFTCSRIWNKLPPRCSGMLMERNVLFQPEYTHPKMRSLFFLTRSALLLTGFFALWGSAAAQTPTQGGAATNSSLGVGVPPASVPGTNQPPPVASADNSIGSLRQRAEEGDAKSQYNLGISYQNGHGVDKDMAEAVKWYRKAADQGLAPAQYNLGVCYRNGYGVDKDAGEAVKWYRKAADQGDVLAQHNLGIDYENGCGVDKDAGEAVKWYRKAADQGLALAQFHLGSMYFRGEGVSKDTSVAANWFFKAAEKGDAVSQFMLGDMYHEGEGVTKDSTEAANWFLKAAYQGNANAQCNLGSMYAQGVGVPQDYGEALAWFIVSSSSGVQMATKARDQWERILGVQSTLLAQQRSKEILKNIERSKAQSGTADSGGLQNQIIGDQPKCSGTGVFVSQDGIIITAAHVIKNALAIKVATQQGLKASHIIKIDTTNDVAVIKCEGKFQAVPIKSSGGVKLGQPVFTVGFPDVQLQGFGPKMTQGAISSLSGIQDDPREWQISVPVQPGNSGGPLFDAHGNVIGLVVGKLDALLTAQATGALPEDVNYAVKTAYILPLLDPYTANLLPEAPTTTEPEKTEDVVGRVQNSVVLILVY